MDNRFRAALIRAFEHGGKSREAAAAQHDGLATALEPRLRAADREPFLRQLATVRNAIEPLH